MIKAAVHRTQARSKKKKKPSYLFINAKDCYVYAFAYIMGKVPTTDHEVLAAANLYPRHSNCPWITKKYARYENTDIH